MPPSLNPKLLVEVPYLEKIGNELLSNIAEGLSAAVCALEGADLQGAILYNAYWENPALCENPQQEIHEGLVASWQHPAQPVFSKGN